MLNISAILLGATAMLGLILIALLQSAAPKARVWLPGALHGLLGLAGLVVLILALGGPPRGVRTGAQNFGLMAAILVGCGVAVGAVFAVARLRRTRPPSLALGVHATFGVAGLVMLVAYLSAD